MIFETVFLSFSFGKGMRSRKVDSVKIVLTLERDHENQGLRGCEKCSKTIEIDVQTYAKSRMQFGSDFYRNFDRFLGYFFIFWEYFSEKKTSWKKRRKKEGLKQSSAGNADPMGRI